jgi:hypothetical protein
MSFKELNSLIVFFKKQEAECTDANELVIIKDNIVNAYAKIKDIVNKQDSELTVKTENSSQNQNVRLIERTLAAQPTFYGTDTVEAEGFLNKMEQLFILLVKEVDPNLEAEFVMHAKLKFGSSVFSQMRASEEKLDTFAKFKKFVTTRFAGQYNAFQRVSKIFDIQFNSNDKYHVYSTKLTEELQSCVEAIREHYGNIDKSKPLSAESVVEFFGGLLMAQKIKIADYQIYRDMVLDFDRLTSATTVAAKAEFYRERTGNASNSTFWAGNQNKSNNQNNRQRQERRAPPSRNNDKQSKTVTKNAENAELKKPIGKNVEEDVNETAETFHSVLGPQSLFQ